MHGQASSLAGRDPGSSFAKRLGLCYMRTVHDTSPAGRRRYNELLRRLTPAERLETVVRLNRGVRELAIAGIAAANPGASPARRQFLLAERLYGRGIALRLYGNEIAEES